MSGQQAREETAMTTTSYLEEAAQLLRKASALNESRNGGPYDRTELYEERLRIAAEFAKLAAIEKGLAPGAVADPDEPLPLNAPL
jgi:hypothetical protein